MTIAPLIPISVELTLALIRAAKDAKEMSEAEFKDVKAKVDKAFEDFPQWDDL